MKETRRKKIPDTLKQKILWFLRYAARSEGFLSRHSRVDHATVKQAIQELQKEGHPIHQEGERYVLIHQQRDEFKILPQDEWNKSALATARVLISSDWHLGSREAQIHLCKKVFEVAEEEKVDAILLPGDLLNGVGIFEGQNRGENRLNNANEQEMLGVEIIKDSKKPTYMRDGNHEPKAWMRVGHNQMWGMYESLLWKEGKKNIHFVSPLNPYASVNGVTFELAHPYKGQTKSKAYGPINALNKRLNDLVLVMRGKLSALMQTGVKTAAQSPRANHPVPNFKAIGNMHTCILAVHAGIAFCLVPCLQKQTGFERAKELWHQVGVWIVTVSVNKFNRVHSLSAKYYNWDNLVREHNEEEIAWQSRIHEHFMAIRPD